MKRRTGIPLALVIAVSACSEQRSNTVITDDVDTTMATAPAPAQPAATAPAGEAQPATAVLRNREGQEVGQATFAQEGNEVVITVNARNLEGGQKGIHIHENGVCEGPTFQTAGGHFNPTSREHGLDNPNGPHAGDLRNLVVDPDDGIGHETYRTDRVTLIPGQPNSLVGNGGRSLVIHAGPDDNVSQPAGNSGDRVVCGVITTGAA